MKIDIVQRLADITAGVLDDHAFVGVKDAEDVCACGWRCDSPSHWEHQAWKIAEQLVSELQLL